MFHPLSACLSLILFVVLAAPAAAATHVVTDFGDSGAPGQLRWFILIAAPGDTIVIPPGRAIVLSGAAGENGNVGGDLDIDKALTIVGSGVELTIIDAAGIDRGIDVLAAGNLVLSGVTVRNGRVDPETSNGGAISNAGTLVLSLSVVAGSSSGGGGGLFNTGTATVESTTFRENAASGTTGAGGAILNFGTMAIGSSTFTQNATIGPSASANGGAINNVGVMTLTNATVSGNRAFGHGGGIYQSFTATGLTLRNVTIAGNEARLIGGGLMGAGPGPKTVNTIVADNRAGITGTDCAGTINSDGHNLIGRSAGCTIAGNTTGNLDARAQLMPLDDNGGPTLTHALRRSSPAIDAGSNAECPAIDQRGAPRPEDGNRDGIAACDIGAFEAPNR